MNQGVATSDTTTPAKWSTRNKDLVNVLVGVVTGLAAVTGAVCNMFGSDQVKGFLAEYWPHIAVPLAALLVLVLAAVNRTVRRALVVSAVVVGLVLGGYWALPLIEFRNPTPAGGAGEAAVYSSTDPLVPLPPDQTGGPKPPPPLRGPLPSRLTNSVGMDFVRVVPRDGSEPFLLMTTKLTQKQPRTIRPSAPAPFFSAAGDGAATVAGQRTDDWPAESQKYADAVAAAAALSERAEEKAAGRRYRLPTVAEFLAGLGSPPLPLEGRATLSSAREFKRLGRPAPVKAHAARDFDLYELVGNLREWVRCDRCPAGKAVALGGSFREKPSECHTACQGGDGPAVRDVASDQGLSEIGFRFVCELTAPAR